MTQWRAGRGVALITAMFVLALAAISATAMISSQQITVRRTENMINNDQSYAYLLGAEQIGAWALAQDKNKTDHISDWRCLIPELCEAAEQQDVWFPVEGGVVGGHVEDMQGRFNLNNLVDPNGQPSPVDIARFRRLLQAVGLEPDLVLAVLDWIDPDQNASFPDGAEDTHYMSLERPYRTHNGPFASPTELLLIKGFDYKSYRALASSICVLPLRSNININTASAAVIMSLADNVDAEEAQSLVDERDGEEGKAYADTSEFLALPLFSGRKGLVPEGLDVRSDHFLLATFAQIGRVGTHQYTIVQRDRERGEVNVLYRTQAGAWEI